MTQTDSRPAEAEAPARRRWWNTLPFVLLVGAAPVPLGLYFLAFVGIVLLQTDRTRESEVRAAGMVLFVWWMYMWRQGATSPWLSALFLAIAIGLLARATVRRRAQGRTRAAALTGLTAVAALATAIVGIVPTGYRAPELTAAQAVDRTLSERRGREAEPDVYLVDAGRARFVHTPLWFVVLYERHPTVERTADGQPCFRHREVWQVDALSGDVGLATYDDAAVVDDPCLPLRIGTERDLKPVPTP